MPKLRQCFDVLIASPSDVTAERSILVDCIEDWNAINSVSLSAFLLPRRWEPDVYPELGDNPQDLIDEQIVKDADLVLAVFWHRIGTPTPKAISGTVQEITHFVEAGKEASLYFSQAALPFNHDSEQLKR